VAFDRFIQGKSPDSVAEHLCESSHVVEQPFVLRRPLARH
jgi:hypothetical protein